MGHVGWLGHTIEDRRLDHGSSPLCNHLLSMKRKLPQPSLGTRYMTLIVELVDEKILWRNLSQWPLDSLAKSMYHQVRAMK